VKYRYSAKAIIIIYHFIYEFTNENNYCESGNEIITSSPYNYRYFIMLIMLLTMLLMSSSFISTVITANASTSNIANIEQQMTKLPLQTNPSNNTAIPNAQSVYVSQSMTLPTSVGTFVWYIVNEAHENSDNERFKYLSNSNPIYLPTNLVIAQGTAISFLDADAPWDSPHPHTVNIVDSSGKVVYSTGRMDYTNSSAPKVLASGKYTVIDTKYAWMKANLTVTTVKSNGNIILGGFYTPTVQVANNKDNDGGVHLGWLGYYTNDFPKNGFSILSKYNFHYAACKYCPGGYWPDQKTADHTLIIYSTSQPLSQALSKLSKMVENNVYI